MATSFDRFQTYKNSVWNIKKIKIMTLFNLHYFKIIITNIGTLFILFISNKW